MSESSALLLLVQQLQQEVQNQRVEIQNLQANLSTSCTDIQQLQQDVQNQQVQFQHQIPRSRLPDPPRFDGKPYHLRTWLPSVKAKLRSDQIHGADAFDYVWDRLEQPQQASVLHLRHAAEEAQIWDPHDIFQFFQRLCHNPHEHQEAVQCFTNIQQ